jgi:methyltransferase (TIGR00027 family)
MIMKSEKHELSGVPETLLIPLWARAVEQTREKPLIIDPTAAKIVQSLDYDFDQFARKNVAGENFLVRATLMDQIIREAIEDKNRSIVEFGPGLDTRFHRLGGSVGRWVEVDFPEVISLRERFIEADPARRLVSRSMLDWSWIDEAGPLGHHPPLFIAEGVFYFLTPAQVREFLTTLAERFPGSSIIFDAVSPTYLKFSNLHHPLRDSKLIYAVGPHGKEFSKWDPRLSVERYLGYGDQPYYADMLRRFPLWKRTAVKLIPFVRHSFKIIQLGLGATSKVISLPS